MIPSTSAATVIPHEPPAPAAGGRKPNLPRISIHRAPQAFRNLFSCLGEEALAELSARSITRVFPKNTVVLSEGDDSDALYLVHKGKLKITKRNASGKEVVLAVLCAGDYFGELALIDGEPRSTDVVTKERSELSILQRHDVEPILMGNVQLTLKIMKGLTQRLRQASGKIASLALMDVYGRVAQLLHDLAKPKGDRFIIEETFTRQDIADLVGSSREMVSRIFKDLVTGGYITIDNKMIILNRTLPRSW